jgi:hypothetical protein
MLYTVHLRITSDILRLVLSCIQMIINVLVLTPEAGLTVDPIALYLFYEAAKFASFSGCIMVDIPARTFCNFPQTCEYWK